jgi:hypothetical protein
MHKLIIQLLGQAKEVGSSSYEHQNNVVMATTPFSAFGIVPKFKTNWQFSQLEFSRVWPVLGP